MSSFARSRAFWLRLALGGSLLVTTSTAFAVTDEERAGARAAASSGLEAFRTGNWQEAIDRFVRAEAVIHSPVHLLYIARAHVELGHLVEAHEAYLKITREGAEEDSPAVIVDAVRSAEAELQQLEPRLPHVIVHVKGAGGSSFQLFVDGREIPAALVDISRPINPGRHEFSARAAGFKSEPVFVELDEGAQGEVTLELTVDPDAPAPVSSSPGAAPSEGGGGFQVNPLTLGGFAAVGVGVAGFVVGTLFLLDSQDKANEADQLCGGSRATCRLDDGTSAAERVVRLNDEAGDTQTIGFIGVGVGAAGLLTGAVLVYLGQKETATETARPGELRVKPYFGFQSVGLTGTF